MACFTASISKLRQDQICNIFAFMETKVDKFLKYHKQIEFFLRFVYGSPKIPEIVKEARIGFSDTL